jgi:hypothetical protein
MGNGTAPGACGEKAKYLRLFPLCCVALPLPKNAQMAQNRALSIPSLALRISHLGLGGGAKWIRTNDMLLLALAKNPQKPATSQGATVLQRKASGTASSGPPLSAVPF